MLASDSAAFVVSVVVAWLAWTQSLQIWHIYLASKEPTFHSLFLPTFCSPNSYSSLHGPGI